MYGVCSGLRYKVMGPMVRREDLLDLPDLDSLDLDTSDLD